ncbi:MAG: hypothetical protein AAF547_01275 [Actinomycetota bacterium]
MLSRIKASPIPLWINLLLVALILLMSVQVYWNYFDNQVLLDSGITIQGDPDQNVIYTTAGRLVAMIVASLFVLVTQNPAQYLVVMLMSAVREAQEGVIDPLYPMDDAATSPVVDLLVHIAIVAAEVAALIVLYRLARQRDAAAVPQLEEA